MPDNTANKLPRIAVIGTGGTISSLGASSLDVLDYPDFGQKLSAEALLDRFPETRLVAEPAPVTVRQVGSTEIGPAEWLELRALIHKIAVDDPATAGFVITHGTATLEETAFFLNLTLGVSQPVVLVGAQRPASALGTDAGINLVNALRVAGTPQARGKGVLVLLNDEISAARDVVKTSTYRLQTFRSLDFGALGHVDGDGVHFFRAPLGAHMPDGPFAGRALTAPLPRVDIVYSYAGADGALIDAAIAAGARGLVSAGFAPGSPTPDQRQAFERAIEAGVVVAQCSRAASGRVAPRRRLRETGIVAGGDLSPQKARILLMLALTGTTDIPTIQQLFAGC
jgi:L-asparaginase